MTMISTGNLKWHIGNFHTGAIDPTPLPAATTGSVERTLASEGGATVEVPIMSLDETQRNNWRQAFEPIRTMLVLVDHSQPWNSDAAIIYAGFVDKIDASVGEGILKLYVLEVGEYLKMRLIIEQWGTDLTTNPLSTESFSGGTWRDIVIKLLTKAFSAGGIPAGKPTPPTCFVVPEAGAGTSVKFRVLRTDARTYFDALGEIHADEQVEYIFVPRFTNSSKTALQFYAEVGDPLVTAPALSVELSEAETFQLSALGNSVDSTEFYSKIYVQSKQGSPTEKVGADLLGDALDATEFPILVERFEALPVETDEASLRGALAARKAQAGKSVTQGTFTVQGEFNPETWVKSLGAYVTFTAYTENSGAGFGGEYRIIGVTHEVGTGTVDIEAVPRGVRYPRVPDRGLADSIGKGVGGGFGGGFGTGGNSAPLRSPEYPGNWTGPGGGVLDPGGTPVNPWQPIPPAIEDFGINDEGMPRDKTMQKRSAVLGDYAISSPAGGFGTKALRLNASAKNIMNSGGTLSEVLMELWTQAHQTAVLTTDLKSRAPKAEDITRRVISVSRSLVIDALGVSGDIPFEVGCLEGAEVYNNRVMFNMGANRVLSTDSAAYAFCTLSLAITKPLPNGQSNIELKTWAGLIKICDLDGINDPQYTLQPTPAGFLLKTYNEDTSETSGKGYALLPQANTPITGAIDKENNLLIMVEGLSSKYGLGYPTYHHYLLTANSVRGYDIETGELKSSGLAVFQWEAPSGAGGITCNQGSICLYDVLSSPGYRPAPEENVSLILAKTGVGIGSLEFSKIGTPAEWTPRDASKYVDMDFLFVGGHLTSFVRDKEFNPFGMSSVNPALYVWSEPANAWYETTIDGFRTEDFSFLYIAANKNGEIYGPTWFLEFNPDFENRVEGPTK